MDSFKSQETYYNGILYRSKNEAKWACFFDQCGIQYMYEPETFILKSGRQYKPDFYLPKYGKYAEVKSSYDGLHTDEMEQKLGEAIDFNQTKISKGIVMLGSFPFDVRIVEGLCMETTWLRCDEGIVCGLVSIYDNNTEITMYFHDNAIEYGSAYKFPKSANPAIKIRKLESTSTRLYEAVKYVNDYQFTNKYNK